MTNKLLSLATLCFSMFLLSAAPGCATDDAPGAAVAAGQSADKVDNEGVVDTVNTQGETAARFGGPNRYDTDVPATDNVDVRGIDIGDILENLRIQAQLQ